MKTFESLYPELVSPEEYFDKIEDCISEFIKNISEEFGISRYNETTNGEYRLKRAKNALIEANNFLLGLKKQIQNGKKPDIEFVKEFLEDLNEYHTPFFIKIQNKVMTNSKYDDLDKENIIKASNDYADTISKSNIILHNMGQKWPEFVNIKLNNI